MSLLSRLSFRQLLAIAFLLIATLLAAVALRGLWTLDRLLVQTRHDAERAVQWRGDEQLIADRSLVMERAARQYVVLQDPALRERFLAAAREAEVALARLRQGPLAADTVDRWLARRREIESLLPARGRGGAERDEALSEAFGGLAALNAAIASRLRLAAEAAGHELQQAQQAAREAFARQVLGAITMAVLLALAFGIWLARPLRRLEREIGRLGENRLDEPIRIEGPEDLRSLGMRLDWLRLRLAELDADKARFLRHVSHELKTPLAALREGVALLEEGVAGRLSDDQREIARILRDNTALLQSQIEALLRFNAAAFEARRLSRRRTELGALVAEVADAQRLQMQAKRLRLEVQGGPLWAEVDPQQLSTALGNLLSNAIRFSPAGSAIAVTLAAEDGQARIEVVDAGPGIAESERERVFEPFFRGERQPEGAVRGSGVGLSIVHEVVAAHGGRVQVLPGGPGARFRIQLPHASTR